LVVQLLFIHQVRIKTIVFKSCKEFTAQAKAAVANKEFLTENEKSEEVALTALFTAAITICLFNRIH
jgi:hypothetical protein